MVSLDRKVRLVLLAPWGRLVRPDLPDLPDQAALPAPPGQAVQPAPPVRVVRQVVQRRCPQSRTLADFHVEQVGQQRSMFQAPIKQEVSTIRSRSPAKDTSLRHPRIQVVCLLSKR